MSAPRLRGVQGWDCILLKLIAFLCKPQTSLHSCGTIERKPAQFGNGVRLYIAVEATASPSRSHPFTTITHPSSNHRYSAPLVLHATQAAVHNRDCAQSRRYLALLRAPSPHRMQPVARMRRKRTNTHPHTKARNTCAYLQQNHHRLSHRACHRVTLFPRHARL